MLMNKEILTLTDIKLLVDSFYKKVQQDELLAPIFNSRIKDKWPEHLQKMYHFWQTILLHEHTYTGSPFLPHNQLPIEKTHFDRWLSLFFETIDEHFNGEKAQEAKWRAEKMAELFNFKIQYYRDHPNKPIQ